MNTISQIRNIIDKQRRSHWDVSKIATGDKAILHHIFNGKRIPRIDTVEAILRELNCRIEIITPDDTAPAEAYTDIPLIAEALNGKVETMLPETIAAPRAFGALSAIRIKGESLSPAYQHNDVVLLMLSVTTPPEQAIGKDALCKLKAGDAIIGKVLASANNTYNIMQYHPSYPPILNAEVGEFYKIIGCLKDVDAMPANHVNIQTADNNINIDNVKGNVTIKPVNKITKDNKIKISNIKGKNHINIG